MSQLASFTFLLKVGEPETIVYDKKMADSQPEIEIMDVVVENEVITIDDDDDE